MRPDGAIRPAPDGTMGHAIDGAAGVLVTVGGLALFLLGIQRIVTAMHALAGARARQAMENATRSPWRALAAGTAVAAASQSGTATSIAAVGLVTSGIMAVREGIALSLGAQVGATLAIQLAAFRISAYALPMLGIGFVLARWPRTRIAGDLLMGAGLLFFGLSLVVDSMAGLRQSETVVMTMATVERSPLAVAAVGFVLGSFLTSSNAVTALALGLFASGIIGLPAAVTLVAAGNAGGTVITIVAARDLDVDAVRVAVMHTLVKLAAAIGIALLAEPFAAAVRSLGGDAARQVANAHTLFNIGVALPGTLLAGFFAGLASRLMPTPEVESGPRYLDEAALGHAAWALALARRETVRVSDEVMAMSELAARHLRVGSWESIAIAAHEAKMDQLTRAVVHYLADVRRRHGADPTSELLLSLVTEVETVGRLIRRLETREGKLRDAGVEYSRAGRKELALACARLVERMRNVFTALAVTDPRLAAQVVDGRRGYERLIAELRLAHLARLEARLPATRVSNTHHLEVLSLLRQIDACLTRIAGYLLAEAGASTAAAEG
jgi:phosphate:Na+ symporter